MNNQCSFGITFACFAQYFACFAVKKNHALITLLIGLFTAAPIHVNGQSEKLSENIIEIAEELAADDTDPQAVAAFIDRLHELAENPVKINSSDEAEISRLFFLSDFQVKALAGYAHSSGRIVSVYELAVIPGFDKETVEMIIPFISLENKLVNNTDSVRWRNYMISNLSIRSGNNDTSYMGSAWRILTKYKFNSGGFSGGITMEKDPGEKFLIGNPPLPDFFSAHLAYTGSGLIKKIILGDFSARFGQGTNINTGIRRGISLTSPGYMSASDEIKPYTSTEENKFFRGAAAELSAGNLELALFFSKNYSDATLASASGSSDDYVESLYPGGVHNTTSLLNKKDAVMESAYGINVSYNMNNLKVGLIWSENRFSLPLNLRGKDPEKIFDFTGEGNNLCSVYYNSLIKNILIYGELSSNGHKKYALIQGISFRPSDRLTINFLFRNYKSGYTAFYGNGPGTGTRTTNEKGVLGNFTFEAAKHLFISGGCDIESYAWLRYRCSAPSRGVRQEIKVRFLPTEKLTLDASYNYRLSMVDKTATQVIPDQEEIITTSFKASIHYSVGKNLNSGTRIDYKNANPSGSRGFLLFQDINYSFRNIPVTIWARFCLFNTDDWASRIYTYENDLLYSFSIPALSGEGSRNYIMAKWYIGDIAEIRIKYGMNSQINENRTLVNTDEIKMQFRVWF